MGSNIFRKNGVFQITDQDKNWVNQKKNWVDQIRARKRGQPDQTKIGSHSD